MNVLIEVTVSFISKYDEVADLFSVFYVMCKLTSHHILKANCNAFFLFVVVVASTWVFKLKKYF